MIETIAKRERCGFDVVGEVTGDNRIVFRGADGNVSVHLNLDWTLGNMPRKVSHKVAKGHRTIANVQLFELSIQQRDLHPLRLPSSLNIMDALIKVLRLPSVGSKRYLTNKVYSSLKLKKRL